MKSILLLPKLNVFFFLLFSLNSITGICQNVYIPDPVLKAILVNYADTDFDGEVQVAEAAAYSGAISLSYNPPNFVSDLTGLEAFTALTSFSFHMQDITTMDLTANTALVDVDCSDNPNLTSIDVSGITSLETLICHSSGLTNLNVSGATFLSELDCWRNDLTTLDVSSNLYLTSLSVSQNELTSLDVSANSVLHYLGCSENQLTSLNVRNGNNSNFTGFYAAGNTNFLCIEVDDVAWASANWTIANGDIDPTATFSENCSTGVNEQSASSFTISPNPASNELFLDIASLSRNSQVEVKLYDLTGKLMYQSLVMDDKTYMDISDFASGTYLVKLETDQSVTTKKFIKQ